MKCAMEAVMMANVNKAIKVKEEQRKAEATKVKIAASTMRFIEEVISPAIDECVVNGRTPYVRMNMGFYRYSIINQTCLDILIDQGCQKRYADGTPSMNTSGQWDVDLDLLKKELGKYCYEVKTCDHWYKTYGMGNRKGMTIEISPSPACLA